MGTAQGGDQVNATDRERANSKDPGMDLLAYAFDTLQEEVELAVGRVRASLLCLYSSGQRYVGGHVVRATRRAIRAKVSWCPTLQKGPHESE
jgi:hypothetical protein